MRYSVKEKNFIEKQYAREEWLGKRGIGGSDVKPLTMYLIGFLGKPKTRMTWLKRIKE